MKKTMKRFASLALAMALAVSMAIGAFAAPAEGDSDYTGYTITIAKGNAEQKAESDKTETGQPETVTKHTYQAYQIFTGSLSGDGKMGQIDWGANVNQTGLIAALKANTAFASLEDTATAADVAKLLDKSSAGSTVTDDGDIAQAFASIMSKFLTGTPKESSETSTGYEITGVTTGYYLIKDKDASQDSKVDGAYTRFVLKVVGDVTVDPKDSVPSVDKEIVDSTGTADYGDYNIGDTVTFKITATLPSKYDEYKKYKLVFTDTMSEGLSVVKTGTNLVDYSIKTADDVDVSPLFTPNVSTLGTNTVITWTCDDMKVPSDLKDLNPGSTLVLTYQAKVNSSADKGNTGNINTVKLTFSNDPNFDGSGEPPTGDTPEDKVVVFTFDLIGNKIDGDTKANLQGVKFKLSNGTGFYKYDSEKDEVTWVAEANADEFTTGSDGNFTVRGIKTGTYTLKETYALPGYNKIGDITIVINATYTDEKDATEHVYQIKTLTSTANSETGQTDKDAGTVSHKIENNKGPVLPSTGGIGTTIFYVVGGVLVIGAAVLLVTKRRMGAEE